MQILINFLLTLHVLISVLIVLVVLMQRPRSEGLGAAFGGGMTEGLFGAQTTTVLTRFTVWLAAAFFGLTMLLAVLYSKGSRHESEVARKLRSSPAVVATPAASPTPADAATPAVPAATPGEQSTPAVPAPSATPAATPVASPAS